MRLAPLAPLVLGLLAASTDAQDYAPVLTDRTQLSNGGTVAAMSDLMVADDGSWSANVLYYLPTREGTAFVRDGEIVYDARPGTAVTWVAENTLGDYVLYADNQSLADPRWTPVWNGAVLLRFPDDAAGVFEGLSGIGDEARLNDAGELLLEVFAPMS